MIANTGNLWSIQFMYSLILIVSGKKIRASIDILAEIIFLFNILILFGPLPNKSSNTACEA